MNYTDIVYIGDRAAVEKRWDRRVYIFKFMKKLSIPDEFAEHLLKTANFILADYMGRTVEESYPAGEVILARRWGALGDLIMFRAACSAFIRTAAVEYGFVLRCQTRFAHLFGHDKLWKGIIPIGTPHRRMDYNAVVTFDQVAEQDHHGVQEHRATLFLKAMTSRTITITPEDWKIPTPAGVDTWVARHLENRGLSATQRDRPLVAVQVRGSGPMKSLPMDAMFMLIGQLRGAGYAVIIIENDPRVASSFEYDDDTYTMCGRDALHSIALLRSCDLAITMDSGALWMAHVADVPTLVILGPTRAEQRIAFHPRYPRQARAVALNELISCPACFESAQACNQRFSCMQQQPDWNKAINVILEEAASILDQELAIPLPIASNQA